MRTVFYVTIVCVGISVAQNESDSVIPEQLITPLIDAPSNTKCFLGYFNESPDSMHKVPESDGKEVHGILHKFHVAQSLECSEDIDTSTTDVAGFKCGQQDTNLYICEGSPPSGSVKEIWHTRCKAVAKCNADSTMEFAQVLTGQF